MLNVSNIGIPSNVNLSGSIRAAGPASTAGQGAYNNYTGQTQTSYAAPAPAPNAVYSSAPRTTLGAQDTASSSSGWRPGQPIPTGYASDGHGGLYNLDVNAGKPQGPQGISQQELDDAYNPVFSDIQNLYDTANNNKQSYLDAATSPFDSLIPQAEQAFTEGTNQNQQQVGQEQNRQANALSQAKQLFNELSQGVQQRFGGAGSASDFAKAFYGRQLQQNEGNIQNTGGQNLNALATNLSNITSQHQNNLQEISAKKAAALSQAQVDFQNRLDQISQLKTATDQQKAQAKLDALATLKATANSINQQFAQFGQQQVLQNQSAMDQLRNSIATAQAYSHQPINLSAIPGAQYANIGVAGNQSSPYMQAVGAVGQKTDQYGNPIA